MGSQITEICPNKAKLPRTPTLNSIYALT